MQENPRWLVLQEDGKFEIEKASLSLMYHPAEIAKIQPNGFLDIFKNDTPTLATVKKYHGEGKSKAAIKLCLVALNDFFGAKAGLGDGQIDMLAHLILQEYYYLTLADLKFCIYEGMMGRYEEKIFGKATPDVIIRWINIHINNRQSSAAEISQAKHEARIKQQAKDFENGEFVAAVDSAERRFYLGRLKTVREKLESKNVLKQKEAAKNMLNNEDVIKARIEELNEALEAIAKLENENS